MSIIKIVANDVTLDVVNETLNIKKENNIFIADFKVSHSSCPFLVIENEKTKQALGTRDITSVLRKKIVPVIVYEMGDRYYGELEIVGYLPGMRKCNIKYGSEVLKIMDKKLDQLLPVTSVIPGALNPVPFTEEATAVIPGYLNWQGYPAQFAGKIFPEVSYQFPTMAWPKKFNDDAPEPDDEWFLYQGYYNAFTKPSGNFQQNLYTITGQIVTVINKQVPSPQLFLLAVLRYAFATIGYKIAGNFVTSEFIRRILLLSTKNNLCKVMVSPSQQYFDFTAMAYYGEISLYYQYAYAINANAAGTYTFNFRVQEPLRAGGITTNGHASMLRYVFDEDSPYIYYNDNHPDNLLLQGSFTIEVSEEQVGKDIGIIYYVKQNQPALPIQFDINWSNNSKAFYEMHPTLQLGRYAPDWTLSTYVNEVKKKFGLEIKFDDLSKTTYFNFADTVITHPAKHIALKSLAVDDYTPPEFTGFILKHENDTDPFVYVDKNGVQLNLDKGESDFVEVIESKFKLVPHNGYTADISTMDDVDGTGLMVYAPESDVTGFPFPIIAKTYNGRTLAFEGAMGIYNICYKKVLQFRLNASTLEISGPFTETEISQINKLQKIYIDSQAYIITAMEYEPTVQDKYQVKLELASINF